MSKILSTFYQLLGLPDTASAHGQKVDNFIVYVHWLMIALFVGWLVYFVFTLYHFRKSRVPKANYFGVRHHGSTYLEVGVVAVEAFLLLFLAIPLWGKVQGEVPRRATPPSSRSSRNSSNGTPAMPVWT